MAERRALERIRWRRYGLVLLLIAALAIRLHGVLFEKRGLTYDESISYLCSAATQGRYESSIKPIEDGELTAADLQALYATPELDFHAVATDMSTLDRHPPLYFWALHVVHHFFGFHLNDGLVLNFIIGLCTVLLLFRIVLRASGSKGQVLLVIAIYSLSPAVGQLDLEARNYQLLGFFALAGAHLSERIGAGRGGPWRKGLFIVVNTCGLLTHYYYAFLMVPGLLMHWRRHGWGRSLLAYAASLAASLALFLLIFPQVFDFLAVYMREPEGVHRGLLARTWLLIYFGGAGFFANGPRLLYAISFAVLAWAAVRLLIDRSLRSRVAVLLRGTGTMAHHAWTLLWNTGFTLVFYYAGIAPHQAVGDQYFSYIWPLFAWFVARGLCAGLPRHAHGWAIGALLLSMLVSLRFAVKDSYYLTNLFPSAWYERMNASDRLITNELRRSHLPRIAIGLRPDLPVHLTRTLEASPEDEAAGEVSVLVRGGDPMKRPVVRVLTQRPGAWHEVLRDDRFMLIHVRTRPER